MTSFRPRPDQAVALLVLAPYAGLLLPFQAGLLLQAGLICLLLSLVALGGDRNLRGLVSTLPSRFAWGLGLYSGAALWGAAVGLLSGNPLRYVASQALAMLMLPMGLLAFASDRRLRGRAVVRGFTIASVIALAVHVAAMVVPALRREGGGAGVRFVLRNDVGITGATVLICLTLLVFSTSSEKERWKLSLPGLGCATVLLLGSLSRGAWLATALGVTVLLVLHAGRRRGIALWAGGAVLVLGLTVAIAAEPVLESGSVLFEQSFEQGKKPDRYLLVDPAEARSGATSLHLSPGSDTWRTPLAWNVPARHRLLVIRAWTKGEPALRLTSTIIFLGSDQQEVGRQLRVVAGTGRWSELRWLVLVPDKAQTFRLWASAGTGQGSWLVDDVTVRGLDSATAAALAQVASRASSLVRHSSNPTTDGGVSYRVLELRSVLSAWRHDSAPRLLVGQGLGATFTFENYTWTRDGRQVKAPKASYIHNFYLFLGFKLGVAGAAAFAGLMLITSWVLAHALPRAGDRGSRWFVAGATASWIAYLAWSVTSPEIYDFRVAPIWGAVLAACWMETSPESRHAPRS